MATESTNFRLTKPDLSDPADVKVFQDNLHNFSHTLKAIELETNAGFAQRDVSCLSMSADSSIVHDTRDQVFYLPSGSTSWYQAGDHTMGRIYSYTTPFHFQFEHPGVYRISYGLRLQTPGTAFTEGVFRTAIGYKTVLESPYLILPGSITATPLDTFLGITDVFCETLVRVAEYNELDQVAYNYGDDIFYSTNGNSLGLDYEWAIYTNHSTDAAGGPSGTRKAGGYSWFSAEFVRPH